MFQQLCGASTAHDACVHEPNNSTSNAALWLMLFGDRNRVLDGQISCYIPRNYSDTHYCVPTHITHNKLCRDTHYCVPTHITHTHTHTHTHTQQCVSRHTLLCPDTHHTHQSVSRHTLLCPDTHHTHTIMCRYTHYCVPTHIIHTQ